MVSSSHKKEQQGSTGGFYAGIGKRLFDLAITVPGLIVLTPVLFATTVAVRKKLGAPALFKQVRPGKDGKPFTLIKFRTMTSETDAEGNLLPDEQRLTAFGQMLRSTSLDELPELINVLRGEMSLVGPRPLLMQYLERYTPAQARRNEVRPGITGLAQVSGRNTLDWDDQFGLDVQYVDGVSLLGDIRILYETVGKVLKRSDISEEGQATRREFDGS